MQATRTRRHTLLGATTLVLLGAFAASAALALDVQAQAIPPAPGSPYTFDGGYPTTETTQRARDDADYARAVVAYHFWYPTVSLEGFFEGNRRVGIADNHALPLAQATPHWVAFTGNSDTPYAIGVLDVKD